MTERMFQILLITIPPVIALITSIILKLFPLIRKNDNCKIKYYKKRLKNLYIPLEKEIFYIRYMDKSYNDFIKSVTDITLNNLYLAPKELLYICDKLNSNFKKQAPNPFLVDELSSFLSANINYIKRVLHLPYNKNDINFSLLDKITRGEIVTRKIFIFSWYVALIAAIFTTFPYGHVSFNILSISLGVKYLNTTFLLSVLWISIIWSLYRSIK